MNKTYPKYKPSGVEWLGDVPEHWEIKRLKYCAPLVTTKAGTLDSNPIALENIESWTGRFIETESEFEGEGIRIQKDDVLFGKLRPYLAKVYLAEKNGKSVGDIFVLRPTKNTASKYLSNTLRTENYIKIIDGSTYGSKMPRASWEFVGGLPFFLPPLPEQQAIAAFLDRETGRIDALNAKKERLLELLAEQRTALISSAVTKGLDASVKLKPSGVEWLGDVPEHWETWKLAYGFDLVGSGTTPPSDELEWYDGTIPWITTSELRENLIFSTDKCVSKEALTRFPALKIFPKGSLAIAMYGATIGRLGILGIEATTNQACCVMHGSQVFSVSFVYFWMQAFKESIILLASGGGQPNISQDKIRSLKIPCPSVPEQCVIASFLDLETGKIDALVAKVKIAIERLKEYRSALISAAVTGKIDVREESA